MGGIDQGILEYLRTRLILGQICIGKGLLNTGHVSIIGQIGIECMEI